MSEREFLKQLDWGWVREMRDQADLFDMDVDWEAGELRSRNYFVQRPAWLQAHIDRNADKQMDHEFMNRDGGDHER